MITLVPAHPLPTHAPTHPNPQLCPCLSSAELDAVQIFKGECSDGKEIRMYEGNGDNPGTAEERTVRCSASCRAQMKPLTGTWTNFVATGFIVIPTNGRCYCESSNALTCKRSASTSPYYRYIWSSPGL